MYAHGEIITAPLFIRSLGTKPTAFRSQPGRRPQPLTLLALRSCSFSIPSRASRLLAQCNRRAVRKNSRLLQPTAWLLGFRGPQPVLTPAARRRRVTRGALCQVPPCCPEDGLGVTGAGPFPQPDLRYLLCSRRHHGDPHGPGERCGCLHLSPVL